MGKEPPACLLAQRTCALDLLVTGQVQFGRILSVQEYPVSSTTLAHSTLVGGQNGLVGNLGCVPQTITAHGSCPTSGRGSLRSPRSLPHPLEYFSQALGP